ncbi:MAG: ABC transporter ATP-binding protein [Pyrinomonadaceae bacterium]
MSNDAAITVERLGKHYRIGARQESYRTLRETMTATATAPFRALRSTFSRAAGNGHARRANEIWALKDVSFEVRRGEAVGVIGRNGAGKSTLLKILSRITEPTSGYADIEGRVGSLLEVGTGFHPELSGRENVFLNGAILGMTRSEIARKFDEIVSFAEVEKFIDTPVKHYSSGMYLRLAFSVAAHLEPEILLVDEVLAVGDMAFQKKCLGKMEDVAAEGRTVLFVSHNLGAVKELCQSAVVLKDGVVVFRGPAVEGVAYYSRDTLASDDGDTVTDRGTRWRELRVGGVAPGSMPEVAGTEPLRVEARLEVCDTFVEARLKCRVDDAAGNTLIYNVTNSDELGGGELREGLYRVGLEVPPLWLKPGIYTLFFKLTARKATGEEQRHTSERVALNVTGRLNNHGQDRALLAPPLRWTLAREQAAVAR